MNTFWIILFFIVGTIFGSFFNVVADRLSNGKSIITPASHCDKCNTKLKWYELIPIVSYICQGGKCRHCKSKIGSNHLIIELVTGVLFASCYNEFAFSSKLVIALIFVSTLIIVIVSDVEYMIILDEVLFVGIVSIIVYEFLALGVSTTINNIFYGICAFMTMYALKLLGDFIFSKESLGGGDIKLMFLFGLVLGYDMAIVCIFLGTFLAFPISIYVLIKRKDNIIPFGPFLSIAAILVLITKLNLDKIISFIAK